MPDIRIGYNSADRRRLWWRNALVTLAVAGVTAAILTTRGPGRWWWAGGLGVLAVVAFVSTANQIHGRVHLTARGLEFRTWVSRRVVPWNEVAGIETRERVTRSGIWSELRVVRVRGRTLTLPGTATNRLLDAELDRKMVAVRACWSRAVGG
ncbi:PH domain-containing protein [Streptomyces albidoflavus]